MHNPHGGRIFEFTRSEGLPRIMHAFAAWVDDARQRVRPQELSATDFAWDHQDLAFHPATAALIAVTNDMTGRLLKVGDPGFEDVTEVSYAERAASSAFFEAGIGEFHVALRYIAAFAAQASAFLERSVEGYASPQSLGEWAQLIDHPHFRACVHALSRTSNGAYRQFGKWPQDYQDGALAATVSQASSTAGGPDVAEAFSLANDQVGDDSYGYLPLALSGEATAALAWLLQHPLNGLPSVGCFGAFHAGTLPSTLAASNPHMRYLVEHDLATVHTAQHGAVHYTLPGGSPIDMAIDFFRDYLHDYDATLGLPTFDTSTGNVQYLSTY